MRRFYRNVLSIVLVLCLLLSNFILLQEVKAETMTQKQNVFLASDSTVQTYTDGYAPQEGWGQELYRMFGSLLDVRATEASYSQATLYESEEVVTQNWSIGGRSSRSFIEEGKWAELTAQIQPGDVVMVQWGHNDATKSRPERYVAPEDFHTYLQQYIDDTKAKGASLVLVTPVARYSYNSEAASFNEDFRAYGDIMRQMAAEQNLPLIDLSKLSINLLNEMGVEGAKAFFMLSVPGSTDATHLTKYGATRFAQLVGEALLGLETNDVNIQTLQSKISIPVTDVLPTAVTDLRILSTGSKSATFEWNTAENAEYYEIYRQEVALGTDPAAVDFAEQEAFSISIASRWTDTSLVAGKSYAYQVRAYNQKGLGEASNIVVANAKLADFSFDFNYNNSATEPGWIGVNHDQLFDEALGYGWITPCGGGRDRTGTQAADLVFNAMESDFNLGNGEFAVNLPNGDYELTIYAGDIMANTSTIKPSYTAEGESIGGISARQSVASMTATVRVEDGQLNLGVGGTNAYINGATITTVLLAPNGLSYQELVFDGGQARFLLNIPSIEDAVSYNIYQKKSNETSFSLYKSVTSEELKTNDLAARTVEANVGETVQYYVTITDRSGRESAKSNVIEVVLLSDDVTLPTAPTNVSFTSVEMGRIELTWESVEGALRYQIYRSAKPEGDNAFVGFEKVGESETTAFVDENPELTTNIHYYYKVSAMNAGGEGELSDVAISDITGELVASAPETLADRALVAIDSTSNQGAETYVGNDTGVFLSWRKFKNEEDALFSLYKNGSLLVSNLTTSNYVDPTGTVSDSYRVEATTDSRLGLRSVETPVWSQAYLAVQLQQPAPVRLPDGNTVSYTSNDMSVGDLDGDGILELIVKWSSNDKDNSHSGYTGPVYLDGYDIDYGTGSSKLLWRINLGVNIRAGAHYTQFQVWDYNGDGKAEIMMKTADGTTSYVSQDGTQNTLTEVGFVGAVSASQLPTDVVSAEHDYRNGSGYVLDGPEYLSVFAGDNAEIIDTVDYIPARGDVAAWGDGYGNRVDRFLAATAYLDGRSPSAIFSRGYYTRTVVAAYNMVDTDGDGIGDSLSSTWVWDSNDGDYRYDKSQLEAQGNHNVSVADVDGDGKDEIVFGALTFDNDGSLMYSTSLGHGDAIHVSDWVSSNPGLEVLSPHEHSNSQYGVEIHDAETGQVLMGYFTGQDTGRAAAGDIDPTALGAEWWSIVKPQGKQSEETSWDSTGGAVYSSQSTLDNLLMLSDSNPAANFTIFWDGDLLSEIQDHRFDSVAYAPIATTISKWDYLNNKEVKIFDSTQILTNNGTKGNMGIVADFLGDWREEIVGRTSNPSEIRIYSTTIESEYSLPSLLLDRQYRLALAWQNTAYNQPSHLSYLPSEGLVTSELTLDPAKKTATSVTLDYTEASDGIYGLPVVGYLIERQTNDGEFTELARVEGSAAGFYVDEEIEISTNYTYRIKSILSSMDAEVFGHVSHSVETYVEVPVKEVLPIDVIEIVQDTAIPEGQNVAALLPKTTPVVTIEGTTEEHPITYDVSSVDIHTVGDYEVPAYVDGWNDPIKVVVRVVENVAVSYKPVEDQYILVSTDQALPATVEVVFKNGSTETVDVLWDDFDRTVVTSYTGENAIKGTTSYDEVIGSRVQVNVYIKEDYIVSVDTPVGLRADLYSNLDEVALPLTLTAHYESGKTVEVQVTSWNTSAVLMDKVGEYDIVATVEDYSIPVVAKLAVTYPVIYQFDFGINPGRTAEGWTEVLVNPKGGTKLLSVLGSLYTAEQGYGFASDSTMEGRNESYTQDGYLPSEVYNDFALPGTTPFLIDLDNGLYEVDIVSGSYYKSSVKGNINGEIPFSVSNGAGSYNVFTSQVEIKDGQMQINFDSGNISRMPAIIIRKVVEEGITPEENVAVGFGNVADYTGPVGSEFILPETVDVLFKDGSKETVEVVWDAFDTSSPASYEGETAIKGTTKYDAEIGHQVSINVYVIQDGVSSVDSPHKVEVEINADLSDVVLAETVTVHFESGKTEQLSVSSWDTSLVDVSTVGEYEITGTIEGVDIPVEGIVVVRYPAIHKFDFGVSAGNVADTWTEVLVNDKGYSKLLSELGSLYSAEQSYGFKTDGAMAGRNEKFTFDGVLPVEVYQDLAIPDGNTFLVDLQKGKYEVDIVSASYGNSSVKGNLEGSIPFRVSNSANTYNVLTLEVEILDGQLEVNFDAGNISRLAALVIREVEVAVVEENLPVSFNPVADVSLIAGTELVMPETVEVVFTDGSVQTVAVVWDTFDTSIPMNFEGETAIKGSTEFDEQIGSRVSVNVYVLPDTIVELEVEALSAIEVDMYSDEKALELPETVTAHYESGKVEELPIIKWDTSLVEFDKIGTYTIYATVEGLDTPVEGSVNVRYPSNFKFDFGIKAGHTPEAWTEVLVNSSDSNLLLSKLGSLYTSELGYGFKTDMAMSGGFEEFSSRGKGNLAAEVYQDYSMPDGNSFLVDLPNGFYEVDIYSASALAGSVKGQLEGSVAFNVANSEESHHFETVIVEVLDGQLEIYFDEGNQSKLPALVIRRVIDELAINNTISGNKEVALDFAIDSATGKGYQVYVSTNGKDFSLYKNVSFNSKGVRLKKLKNGTEYTVYIAKIEQNIVVERSANFVIRPNK